MVHRRPQTEEEDDDEVDNCKGVDRYTEDTRYTPGAPREFLAGDVGERVRRARVELDIAAETTPEEKHSDDEIGTKQADDGEGDDVVENGGGTEHDKGGDAG